MSLNKHWIGTSMLDGTMYLYRAGKNGAALERREAEPDVVMALVQHMMFDAPKGSSKVVSFGGGSYEITVVPVDPASDDGSGDGILSQAEAGMILEDYQHTMSGGSDQDVQDVSLDCPS